MEVEAVKLVYWHNGYSGLNSLWVIQLLDAEGNQVGDACESPNKRTLKCDIEYMEKLSGFKAERI